MTQEAAQQQFWSGFGLDAYPNTAVPKNPKLPYLTYQAAAGYENSVSNVTVQLWFWTDSEAVPNAKADEIGRKIGFGGIQIPCDGGTLWLKRGNPWRVATTAQDENSLKVRQLNVTIQHLVKE